MLNFTNLNSQDILELLIRIPVILFSLTLHEVAHGYAAYKMGDPTAKNLGRLTLNPIKHLDPIGALCMLLFRFGWAKPVPINTRYFKKPRRGMAISALAGPLSNLLLSFVSYIISVYIAVLSARNDFFGWNYFGDLIIVNDTGKILYILYLFFETMFVMNIFLAVFNLLPIPPLDGSRIMFVLLPDKYYFGIMKYEQFISIGLMAALWLGLLDTPLNFVFNLFYQAFGYITQFLPFL